MTTDTKKSIVNDILKLFVKNSLAIFEAKEILHLTEKELDLQKVTFPIPPNNIYTNEISKIEVIIDNAPNIIDEKFTY